MTLEILTPPTVEPLSLDDAKAHSRQDPGTIEDSLILGFVKSARAQVETYLRRKLIDQTLRLSLSCFFSRIALPAGPVRSLALLTYLDNDGVRQTLAASEYRLVKIDGEAFVVPARDKDWPTALSDFASVQVDFIAGYGPAATDVPHDIVHAVRLLVAHYAENREAIVIGTISSDLPLGVIDLLAPHRRWV